MNAGFFDVFRLCMGWWNGTTAQPVGNPVPAMLVAEEGNTGYVGEEQNLTYVAIE